MAYSIDFRKKVLSYVDRDRLKNYLTDNPDAYLTEIASEFG
ncbi:IS630 family transposase, partial [Streptococcus pneumoniae]|nr:IS630 family transposase [Streptococcus pneumoniae]MDS4928960.1 IS630 family transposase [Streptococcus pneumoniae]